MILHSFFSTLGQYLRHSESIVKQVGSTCEGRICVLTVNSVFSEAYYGNGSGRVCRLGIFKARECLHVGDDLVDLACKQAGLFVCQCESGHLCELLR